jgi:L-ascorbate metabolism protein UlaG (beta-lactamase superfamily)
MHPVGGLGNNTWTMDVSDAFEAVKLIAPGMVIPCHYNVLFLWIKNIAPADDQLFEREVENQVSNATSCSMAMGLKYNA